MAEINNNNFVKYTVGNKPIEVNNKDKEVQQQPQVKEEGTEPKYVPDTGVLGRSQVKSAKGGDITKSVDDAIKMVKEHPALVEAGEVVFDSIYEQFLADGLSEADAYAQASLAVDEFCQIALAH